MSGTHHQILTKLGADRVVQPEKEIGQHVAQMLPALLALLYAGLIVLGSVLLKLPIASQAPVS